MSQDYLLMIPHLSKELNLIGYPALPYTLEKTCKTKSKSTCKDQPLKIIFNSGPMIEALTSVCFELVKQVKCIGECENNELDKVNFENSRLEKLLRLNKSETEKIVTELSAAKKANTQLQEKIDQLEKKIKCFKIEHQNAAKRNQTNENILRHGLRKKESEIFELHKAIWKNFNMANQNYFPENFKLMQLNQPDFRKLWSTVEYSDKKTKEEALKEAVYIFQNNNKALMEENFSLKTTFLTTLQQMQEIFKLMVDKLHFPASVLIDFKVKQMFEDGEGFNFSLYISILQRNFNIFRKICELFEEASFTVSDNLFICWSSITRDIDISGSQISVI